MMKSTLMACALTLSMLLAALPAFAGESGSDDGIAEWTFIIYMDGDNNLEGAAVADFNELEIAGSTANVNIVVLFDRIPGEDSSEGDWTGTRKYLVQKDDNLGAFGQYDEGVNVWGSETEEELNMGDPNVLVNFTNWAIDAYPAQRYFIDLWNHGGAFWGVCWDDSSGGDGDCINMTEMSSALCAVTTHAERKMDIVGFDACLMAQVAVLYQMADYCDYSVASAFAEPGDGWPYEKFMPDLVANPTMAPQDLGKMMVDDYMDSYTDRQQDPQDSFQVSMACFDMSRIPDVARALSELGMVLATGTSLSVESSYYAQLRWVRSNTKSYDLAPVGPFDLGQYCIYDAVDFLDKLNTLPSASQVQIVSEEKAMQFRAAISDSIVHSRANNAQFAVHCLTFYFPSGTQTVYDERYSATKYAKEMYWDDFLHNFDAETFEANFPPSVYLSAPEADTLVQPEQTSVHVAGEAYDVQNSVIMVQVKLDDGSWINAAGTTNWTAILPTIDLAPGMHTISARSYDGTGYSPEVQRTILAPQPPAPSTPKESYDYLPMSIGLIVLAAIICAAAIVIKRKR